MSLGYVALRTSISTADAPLISTGELLSNLLGGGLPAETVMARLQNSAALARFDETGHFVAVDGAIPATRIAFIADQLCAAERLPRTRRGARAVARSAPRRGPVLGPLSPGCPHAVPPSARAGVARPGIRPKNVKPRRSPRVGVLGPAKETRA